MTIPELMTRVLDAIRNQFYADRPREFLRDERALSKAVARYGYECHRRGWEFSAEDIRRDLMDLLNQIKRLNADIGYLPVYLEGAVARHIGQRAEELSVKAKYARPQVDKIVTGLQSVKVVIQATNVEMLSAFYLHQKQVQRQRRAARKPARDKQEALL